MSKNINPSAIGAFFVGSIFLLVAGLMIFGRGNIFEQKVFYKIYFDKSVNGLNVGSPVLFRGIRIGQVTDIRLSLKSTKEEDSTQNHWPIQVTLKLLPKSFDMANPVLSNNVQQLLQNFNPGESEVELDNWLRNMVINKGLRAQLQTQSMLTGMLHIEFDLFDNEVATKEIKMDFERGIIPVRISAIERLYDSLNNKDFSSNVEHFHTIVNFIGDFVQSGRAQRLVNNIVDSSENLKETTQDARDMLKALRFFKLNDDDPSAATRLCKMLANLDATVAKVNVIMDDVNKKLPGMMARADATIENIGSTSSQLTPKIDAAIADARRLIQATEKAVAMKEGPSAELVQSLQATLEAIRLVMSTAQGTLKQLDSTIASDSPLHSEVNKALEEVRQTTQSFRSLVDLIQQNPEILIQGRRD